MDNEEAKRLYFRALERYGNGAAGEALRLLDTLAQSRPDSRHVLVCRARCLSALGRTEDALRVCDRLAQRFPEDRWEPLRGEVGDGAGNTAPPAACADTADADAALEQPAAQVQKGLYEQAVPALTAYVSRHPDSARAHSLLAQALLEADPPVQDLHEALRLAAQAHQLGSGDDPAAVATLAKALAVHGRAEEGLACLERLYNTDVPAAVRQDTALRIRRFRMNYGLGRVYQVCRADGTPVREYADAAALAEAARSKTLPADARCRLDRTGPAQPLERVLAREAPAVNRAAGAEVSRPAILGPLLAGMGAAVAAALAVLYLT